MSSVLNRDIAQNRRDIESAMDAIMALSKSVDNLAERLKLLENRPKPGRPPNGHKKNTRSD